jgi:hypothetical protein
VRIEELDIADLKDWLSKTDNADIKKVYTNLLTGSVRHLQAFQAELDRL